MARAKKKTAKATAATEIAPAKNNSEKATTAPDDGNDGLDASTFASPIIPLPNTTWCPVVVL